MGLGIFYSGAPGLNKLKSFKNSLKKLYKINRKGYFYPVTKSNIMTFTSDLAAFSALTQDDLYTIIDALQAKVRSTEAFIHNQIEPVKDKYPTLLKAYSKQLDDESTTLHRFKAIVYDEI